MTTSERIERITRANRHLAKVAFQWLHQQLCFAISFCLVGNQVLRNACQPLDSAVIYHLKMRCFFIISSLLLLTTLSYSQTESSRIEIYKLYSENGEYYLQSIPFDNEEESLFGKSYVFKTGQGEPLYSIDRHFNYTGYPNKINLSNDGQTIFYINDIFLNDNFDEQKAITVYVKGTLCKSYTVSGLNGCNTDKQDCYLLYKNSEVINRDSTTWTNHQLLLGFNQGTSVIERFANSSNIFSSNDSVYLIDQFRQLKTFDLKTGDLLNTTNFDSNYIRLTNIAKTNSIQIETIDSPSGYDLPLLADGNKVNEALASHLNMATMDIFDKDDNKYKRYTVVVNAIIDINGKMEINEMKVDGKLPEKEIRDFLTSQKFEMKDIPQVLEKWRFDAYIYLRNKSKSKAKKEKQHERIEEREAYVKRLTKDSINGFYIPQNLGECFVQLDTLLTQYDRKEMKELSDRFDMIRYHHGLGMYLRNNWGLWKGSRLQNYFSERGVYHPDSMSGIILDYYHDWLNGKTETWKDWEKENEIKKE
jgi:hypothetical protein